MWQILRPWFVTVWTGKSTGRIPWRENVMPRSLSPFSSLFFFLILAVFVSVWVLTQFHRGKCVATLLVYPDTHLHTLRKEWMPGDRQFSVASQAVIDNSYSTWSSRMCVLLETKPWASWHWWPIIATPWHLLNKYLIKPSCRTFSLSVKMYGVEKLESEMTTCSIITWCIVSHGSLKQILIPEQSPLL